jgi:hypothetical protein
MRAAETKPAGPPTFASEAAFRAMGYWPAPCPWGESAPVGHWNKYASRLDEQTAPMGVSIVCGAWEIVAAEGHVMRNSWCAALCVETHDKRLARDIDAVVQSHLVYRDGVERASPVRTDSGKPSTLRPFALAPGVNPLHPCETRPYYLPKDPPKSVNFTPHRASIVSAGASFVASGICSDGSPFQWLGGDLTTVHRDSLPILTQESARALLDAIEARIEAVGGQWWI